jgi:hypothetical protein
VEGGRRADGRGASWVLQRIDPIFEARLHRFRGDRQFKTGRFRPFIAVRQDGKHLQMAMHAN